MKGTWPTECLVLAATSLMFCYNSANNDDDDDDDDNNNNNNNL